jgi:hypothetical protein
MKLFFLICCVLLFWLNATLVAQPFISLGKDSLFDFGMVYKGAIPVRHVTITNTGIAPLLIEQVNSPCGCTTTQLNKNQLAPGDTADLTIRFNSDHFIGKVEKYLLVVSNDYLHRNFFIRYKAEVVNILQATPIYVYFGNVASSGVYTQLLTLKNTSGKKLRVKNITTTSDELQPEVTSFTLAPEESTQLKLLFRPRNAIVYKDELRIETDNPDQPVIKIPVKAIVN